MNMQKKLIVLRGIPGSGKSTVAEYLAQLNNATLCEADSFFYNNGKYEFDSSKLNQAHKECQDKCNDAMRLGKNVIVSNTTTTEKEIRPYIEMAETYEYTIFSLIVENRHGNPSRHNVPEESIQKMKARFSIKL